MTSQDPNTIIAEFHALLPRWKDLYEKASMQDIRSTLTEITDKLHTLPDEIVKIRQRGYVFASYLEQKHNVLNKRWNDMKHNIEEGITRESQRLRSEFNRNNIAFQEAERSAGNAESLQGKLPDLKRRFDDLEERVRTTVSKLNSEYSTLQSDISQTSSQLYNINWYLDQRDEASFKFLAGESLFLAAKAEWVATGKGKDDPDGILYLTDQRLVFEQKETTGKTLGLFGGKKTQELEWEIPLNLVSEVKAENKGFFGGKDMLYFTLKPGAKHSQITVEVKGGVACKFWAAQVQRMISGNTKDERAVQPDAEELEAIKNAPTACPSCGGTLPMLVAGQRQIDCEYCGGVVRI